MSDKHKPAFDVASQLVRSTQAKVGVEGTYQLLVSCLAISLLEEGAPAGAAEFFRREIDKAVSAIVVKAAKSATERN